MDISLTTLRLFIHVTAATIWVGGQLTLAGLVPAIRPLGSEVTKLVARRFAMLAWPAFVVLTFTGIWNALAIDMASYPSSYQAKFGLKMTCYLITGIGAALHQLVKRKWALALGGAMGGLGALGALFFAVALKY